MASLKDSALVSAIKSQDLTLTLEIPLQAPSDSSSCSLNFSVGQALIPLRTSEPLPPISPPSAKDLAEIGNSDSLPTILGQET